MSIYAISDLHLSFGTDKPMDVFGSKWTNYEEKIKANWIEKVTDSDTVIIAGDFSWATYLEDSVEDFRFVNNLPGKKIILKGNHDYWWTTLNKMNNFIKENNFKNIFFLHNNFYECEEYLICGTRYWDYDETYDNEKIFNREIERLTLSINAAMKYNDKKPIIIVTHYPPDEMLISKINTVNVKKWIYGHIHGNYEEANVHIENIDSFLTSSDYLKFDLIKIA
jgi:predicted phosphohydrolase